MPYYNRVYTFGCRLNFWESGKINNILNSNGCNNTVVFNTCSVTNEAVKNCQKAIRSFHKKNPDIKIVVTGCGAESDKKFYQDMKEVSKVINNSEKLDEKAWMPFNYNKKVIINDTFNRLEKENPSNSNVRKFLSIQNGCNHSCTFCIIPSCRGSSVSRTLEEINHEIELYLNKNIQEIILTGVDITSWGQDFTKRLNFSDLIELILKKNKKLKRLRLSSIDIAELDDKFLMLIKNQPRIMPHFHLSLQSLDNLILKRMKRRHSVDQIFELFYNIRKSTPHATFGADLISGFPTESEDMFLNSYNNVKELNITHLHVFPYSAKKGTPASKMPQVSLDIRRRRAKELRQLGNENYIRFLNNQINKSHNALIETEDGFGKTENNLKVKIKDVKKGNIVKFTPNAIENNHLVIN